MIKRRKTADQAVSADLADVNEQELAKDTYQRSISGTEEKREDSIGGDLPKNVDAATADGSAEELPVPARSDGCASPVAVDLPNDDGTVQPRDNEKEAAKDKERTPPPSSPPKRRYKSGAPYVAVILLCLALGIALVVGAALSRERDEQIISGDHPTQGESDTEHTQKEQTGGKLGAEEIYARGVRSSVSVAVTADGNTEYYSGVAVFDGGYVATLCEAVMADGIAEIVTCDGSVFPASVVGADRTVNLALLRTDATELERVSVGSSQSLSEGNSVFAIGNVGGGRYASSLLATQVAYRERQPLMECCDGVERKVTVIQLGELNDASLKGCPIFDVYGQAVAIMLASAADGQASLAIPLDKAMAVLEDMLGGRTPSQDALCSLAYAPPSLGILGQQSCLGEVWGVKVVDFSDAVSDSASKLRVGDLIWKVNDAAVTDTSQLREQTERYRAGDSVEVFVWRYGQALSFYVRLE